MSNAEDLPDTLTVELKTPIELKGQRHTELVLREPRAIDVRQAESHLRASVNVETLRKYQIALIAKVAGVPEPVVEAMAITQLNEAAAYLQGFIEAGRKDGAT